jgi:hypothetical protein
MNLVKTSGYGTRYQSKGADHYHSKTCGSRCDDLNGVIIQFPSVDPGLQFLSYRNSRALLTHLQLDKKSPTKQGPEYVEDPT